MESFDNIIDRRIYFFEIWEVLYEALYSGTFDDVLFEDELEFVHENLVNCECEIASMYNYIHNKYISTKRFKTDKSESDEEIDI